MQIDYITAINWKDGRYTFDNIPLEELIRIVNQKYDSNIVLNNRKKGGAFSGSIRYDATEPIHVIDGDERYCVSVASPILSEGDILGCVIFVSQNASAGSDIEFKLAQTVASFLGKQMES